MKNLQKEFPITKKKIQNHFAYAWWQYAVLIGFAVFGWNILYTMTGYRVPEEYKVEWYYDGYVPTTTSDQMVEWMQSFDFMAEMEEVTFTAVGYDETYGDMQFMVWVAAGEGDLYMLGTDRFIQMGDGIIDLQPYIDSGALDVTGIDLTNGYVTDADTGEVVLRGIPTESLTGFEDYGVPLENHTMSILSACGNVDVVIAIMNEAIQAMKP